MNRPSPRFILWIASFVGTAILCGIWASLPSLESLPLLRVLLFAAIGLLMLILVFSFPERSPRRSRLLIIGAAIVLRLILLPAPASDDVHRYIWEGQLVSAGESPFAAAADDDRWLVFRNSHWEQMNHRERPTAYPPAALLAMSAAALTPEPALTLKLAATTADLATLFLVLLLLRRDHLPARWAGFYAFNPIVLIAFAAEAHYDSLMVVAMVGSLFAATSKRLPLAFFLLALAVQLKFIAILLLPLLIIEVWRKRSYPLSKRPFVPLLTFAVTLLLPALPFLTTLPSWLNGLSHFANTSAFNGPLFTLISLSGLSPESTRPLCYAAFAFGFLVLLIASFRGLSLLESFHVALTLLLLCSPIVHFWYLAWLIPLITLRPSFGWTVASVTMAGYFLAWHTEARHGWWGFGHFTAATIWMPALIAFAAHHRQLIPRVIHHFRKEESPAAPKRLGIVIPTLDPGPRLPELVEELRQETHSGCPIILADASETPPPPTLASYLSAPKGRGCQIAAGIDAMNTDWVLIAHADTTPRPGWHRDLLAAIDTHPEASMFVLGQRFDQTRLRTLVVEILNELRVVFGGVAFGDQTMVVRRSALEASGGFPAQELMEDVEASLRLHTRGRIIYLGQEWKVSAVKWQSNFSKRFVTVLRLVATYQLARLGGPKKAAHCARRLYAEYYS
ncbi:glycosyltransferase [Haloferula sp.]|uniref:glycosyltransferase n=1 Tax=Haloferula sp. TaxID=2497595 RepID=UPI003C743BE1